MVKVTVGLGTSRPGGLDISLDGLSNQTYEDFELVIIDGRYHKRHARVLDYAKKIGFKQPLYHVPNQRYSGNYSVNCSGVNTGFMLAEGELFIMLLDYSYTPTDWIANHIDAHKGKQRLVFSPHLYLNMPHVVTKDGSEPQLFPGSGLIDMEGAAKQRENFDEISIFDKPFDVSDLSSLVAQRPPDQDPKLALGEGPSSYPWMHTKNESFPTKTVLDIGGIDEYFDVGSGPGDTEFGFRLWKAGLECYLTQQARVYCMNPRWIFPRICRRIQDEYNVGVDYINKRMNEISNNGSLKSNNNYDMYEKRKILLSEWKPKSQEREAILPYNEVDDKTWYPKKFI